MNYWEKKNIPVCEGERVALGLDGATEVVGIVDKIRGKDASVYIPLAKNWVTIPTSFLKRAPPPEPEKGDIVRSENGSTEYEVFAVHENNLWLKPLKSPPPPPGKCFMTTRQKAYMVIVRKASEKGDDQ